MHPLEQEKDKGVAERKREGKRKKRKREKARKEEEKRQEILLEKTEPGLIIWPFWGETSDSKIGIS